MKKLGLFAYRLLVILGLIGLSSSVADLFNTNPIGLVRLQSDIYKALENTAYNEKFWDEPKQGVSHTPPNPGHPTLSSVESVIHEYSDKDLAIKPDVKSSQSNEKRGKLWERSPLDTAGLIPIPDGVLIDGCRYRLRENVDLNKALPATAKLYANYKDHFTSGPTSVEVIYHHSAQTRSYQFYEIEFYFALIGLGLMINSLLKGDGTKKVVVQNYLFAAATFGAAALYDFIFWKLPIWKLEKLVFLGVPPQAGLSLVGAAWTTILAATVVSGMLWAISAFWEKPNQNSSLS
jgi:hypothetical protein